MIDAFTSLWRELLGSWWVLVLLPVLLVIRALLISRWPAIARARTSFLSHPIWNSILSAPPDSAAHPKENGKSGPVLEPGEASAPIAVKAPLLTDPAEFRRRWFLELIESGLVALFLVFFIIRPFVVQAFYIPSPSMVETLEVDDRILVNKFIYRVHTPQRGDVVVFEPPALATDKQEDDWIKRVIGVAGDHIGVHDNQLFLNGKPQVEPYVALLDRSTDKPGLKHVSTGQYTYTFPDPNYISLRPGQNAYVKLAPGASIQVPDPQYEVKVTTDASPTADGDYLFFVHADEQGHLEAVVPPGKVFVMGDNRNDSEDGHYWGYLDHKKVLGQAFCIFWPFSHFRFLSNPHSH